MLISVFARGRGAGSGPVNYVTAETVRVMDAEGKAIPGQMLTRDPAPVLMAGDPGLTRALIDSSPNQWKYTSGVIAFERSDAPTDAEQRAVMADFERLAFAGLAKDEYNVLWVKHEHCGNVELHFVAPRLYLGTGKAYNPCPPGHQAAHDALRDAWNYSKGWADPADPGRARMTKRDDHQMKIEASALRAGLALADDPKALIGAYLVQRLEDGQIQNRADLLAALEETGLTISRQGKDYVSVRDGDAKPIRLKGIIYDSNFAFGFDRAAEIRRELGILDRPAQEQDQGRRAGDQRVDAERADCARQQLEATIGRRLDFNAGRYHPAERDAATAERDAGRDADRANELSTDAAGASPGSEERGPERGAEPEGFGDSGSQTGQGLSRGGSQKNETEREPVLGQAEALGLDAVGSGGRELPLSLRSDLGLVGVGDTVDHGANAGGAVSSHERPVGNVQHRSRAEALPASELKENEGGQRHAYSRAGLSPFARAAGAGGIAGPARSFQPWRGDPRLGDLHHRLHGAFSDLKGWYDRTRTTIGERIRGAWEAIRGGRERLVTASADLELAAGRSNQQQREVGQGVARLEQQTERACRGLKMQREDELTRFKTDINLVEYVASKGYQVIKGESSKASTVMVDGQGDKLIIATAEDGHGIYFSVRDDADNGSIIDFVQRRQGLNLGQVRKELRPWIGEYGQAAVPVHAARKPEAARAPKPVPTSRDRQQVLAVWSKMEPAGEHRYLIDERKLSPEVLADPRFAGQVRIDGKGNAVFPHYDRDGITGYELKNAGFTGFAKGGEKGLWYSSNLGHAGRVVVVESAIDAMSHAQINGDQEAAYISVGGSMSDKQRELLAGALAKAHQRGAAVVLATDADEPGKKLADQVQALAPAGALIEREEPEHGNDWNDAVKHKYALEEKLQLKRSYDYDFGM
jgi:5S rRNA maturation endonuclease (ribonuclease M5)